MFVLKAFSQSSVGCSTDFKAYNLDEQTIADFEAYTDNANI